MASPCRRQSAQPGVIAGKATCEFYPKRPAQPGRSRPGPISAVRSGAAVPGTHPPAPPRAQHGQQGQLGCAAGEAARAGARPGRAHRCGPH